MYLSLQLNALMYEHSIFITVFVHVSLHSQALSIVMFNGLNFHNWCDQVQFHLGVLDLDLALQTEKQTPIIDSRTDEQRSFNKA